MKRSSKMVPFTIIVVLAVLIAAVVTVRISYPNLSDVYDVLEITSLKASSALPNTELLPGGTSDVNVSEDYTNQDATDPTASPDTQLQDGAPLTDSSADTDLNTPSNEVPIDGDTFEFNKTYFRTINADDKQDKIEIFTVSESYDYRVNIKTNISDNRLQGVIYVSVYDDQGILVEKQDFMPYYGTDKLKDEFQLDFHLKAARKYTLKIHGDNATGDYQISISTLERDAGFDKDSASLITLGEEVHAVANSSLSDWYALDIPEGAKYEITFHNIEVGCRLRVRGTLDNSTLFTDDAKSEDTMTATFFVRENARVYIEVAPEDISANGKYIMTIKKKEG